MLAASSDIDIYIAELEVELSLINLDEYEDSTFNDADIANIKSISDTSSARHRSIYDFPGSLLLLNAKKSLESSRCLVFEELDGLFEGGLPRSNEIISVSQEQPESHHTPILNDDTSEPIKSDENNEQPFLPVDVERNNFSTPDSTFAVDIDENDLDRSLDILIEQAESQAHDHTKLLAEKQQTCRIEHKKRRDALSARKIQRFVRQYISKRKQILFDRLISISGIAAKIVLGSSLDRWITFIRTGRRAGRVLRRFCRRVCSKYHRIIVSKSRHVKVHAIIVLFDSGCMYFSILNPMNSGLSVHFPFCFVCSNHPGLNHCFVQQRIKRQQDWFTIMALLRRTTVPNTTATKIPIYLIRPHELVCYSKPNAHLRNKLQARIRLSQTIHCIAMRWALRRIVWHWKQRIKAAVCIQSLYRCFSSKRFISSLLRRKHWIQSSLMIQRTFRGFILRMRLRSLHDTNFEYKDREIDCILNDNVSNLIDIELLINGTDSVWEPCKPTISPRITTSHDVNSDPGLEDEDDVKHRSLEKSNASHQTCTKMKEEIVEKIPSIHQRERNRITKQWRTNDEQLIQVSQSLSPHLMLVNCISTWAYLDCLLSKSTIKKRSQMRKLGASGLAMKHRMGRRR
jgi:hypothetical protein